MTESQYVTPKDSPKTISTSQVVLQHTKRSDGALNYTEVLTVNQRWAKRYRTEIAASASSIASTFVAFPLDSVKTRLQVYKFRSFWDCVTQTRQTEGVRAFWRGGLAPLCSVTLVRTVNFSLYSKCKIAYATILEQILGNRMISQPNTTLRPCNPIYWFLSGATAGGVLTFIACPFELTKISAQTQMLMHRSQRSSLDDPSHIKKYETKGTIQSARDIVKARGLLGLYSGFHLHFVRDVLGTAMYFTFYESGKLLFGAANGPGPLAIAASGGLCGLMSWLLIYPVDSAKAIYQRDVLTHQPGVPLPYRGIRWFNRRMYRGLTVSMVRSCILNAVFFSSYEFLKRQVNEFTGDKKT